MLAIGETPMLSNGVHILLLAVFPRITEALAQTRMECSRTKAEQEAFRRFIQRVASIEPANPSPTSSISTDTSLLNNDSEILSNGSVSTTSSVNVATSPLESVRNGYAETVMAVDHYEQEYDESLRKNLAVELGTDLAHAVTTNNILTPQVQAAILKKSRQAREDRSNFLHRVQGEYNSLIDSRRQLRELSQTRDNIKENLYPRPIRELIQSWNRLDALADDSKKLLNDRQSHIHAQLEGTLSEPFQCYLYDTYEWTYPVLNDGLELLTEIRASRHQALKSIYNW